MRWGLVVAVAALIAAAISALSARPLMILSVSAPSSGATVPMSAAPSGGLVSNTIGSWSWGNLLFAPNTYNVLLNGVVADAGSDIALNTDGNVYLFFSPDWYGPCGAAPAGCSAVNSSIHLPRLNFSPTTVSVGDATAPGTIVATMSGFNGDNTAYTGTYTVTNVGSGLVVSGSNLVVAPGGLPNATAGTLNFTQPVQMSSLSPLATAKLSVQVTHGGSILPTPPAGKTWVLDSNDEFNGTAVASFWEAADGCSTMLGCNLYAKNSEGLSVSGGVMTMSGVSQNPCLATVNDGMSCGNHIQVQMPQGDGYYEVRLRGASGMGSVFWGLSPSNQDCAGGYNHGLEADIFESFGTNQAQINTHWGGYMSCHNQDGHGGVYPGSSDAFHIYGLWLDATNGVTYYWDGAVLVNLPGPLDLTVTGPFYIGLETWGNGNLPMIVDWFRYYRLQ